MFNNFKSLNVKINVFIVRLVILIKECVYEKSNKNFFENLERVRN